MGATQLQPFVGFNATTESNLMVSSVHVPSGHFDQTLGYQNSSDTSHSNVHLSQDVMSYGSRKPYADSVIVSL
jgi:hypothetical protein